MNGQFSVDTSVPVRPIRGFEEVAANRESDTDDAVYSEGGAEECGNDDNEAERRVMDEYECFGTDHEDIEPGDSRDEVVVKDEEEAEVPKIRRKPKGLSKRERKEHEATHLPFRDWCRHCVRGRGRNNPHRSSSSKEDNSTQRIYIDYHFMSQEEEKASRNPILMM